MTFNWRKAKKLTKAMTRELSASLRHLIGQPLAPQTHEEAVEAMLRTLRRSKIKTVYDRRAEIDPFQVIEITTTISSDGKVESRATKFAGVETMYSEIPIPPRWRDVRTATGKDLDEIGAAWGVWRGERPDQEYREAIEKAYAGPTPLTLSPETCREGDPRPDCGGTMEVAPGENCSCHLSAPCGSCVEAPLKCDKCGH